ncbi:ADP-ribosylation factor-binding protein GGA1-like isoform X2 [Thunnus albacares]|uniref:ADP-ribosylation factor-binding protein GGA1-like isoform X2 n=1 Tax=Thunnus maccoyii TaxID=8240 RepID=UPI001C4CC59A|nr:ADP-ribosylation factor-binding protein GGA1-like isoform X2 [Thunnus maccoyii]XP_044188359.1 ADP-ribosylation factor-binding protein GGA1-like isoform X2 [Thunnus albacares]
MAAPPDAESLESRINRATNPLNKDTDWSSIHAFCDQLNNDLEGPQLATRLLAHKIQSPQEWEAMQALLVLETCMKSCGKRFHSEVGKFRFLNELIKVVSPKYLGARSPEPVKKKVLELIYSWTLGLPDEAKISDAYQMLKKQGIIKQDPELPPDKLLNLPPPRPKNAIFEDEEKSKMLSRLLNSSHPEDLKAANKLIKEMVQEDQKRAEKVSKRVNAIQEVKESVTLLTQLLQDYDSTASNQSNAELIQDLYQRCEKMRPTLFRLASDTEDNDEALAEILQANDSLTHVINLYKQQVKGEIVNGNNTLNTQKQTGGTALLDLTGLDTSPQSPPSFPEFPTPTDSLNAPSQETGISLLDDELMSLGLSEGTHTSNPPSQPEDSTAWDSFQSSDSIDADIPAAPSLLLSPDPPSHSQPLSSGSTPGNSALDELDLLGKTLLQQSLPPEGLQVKWDKQQSKPTLRDLQSKTGANITPHPIPTFTSENPAPLLNSQPSLAPTLLDMSPTHTETPAAEVTLTDVFVPLESIKPSSLLPVTVFDGHSLRVLFHFARDSPPSRPDVLVVIISMLSSAPVPVTNINFQTTAPKSMAVKLQPPSGTELPAFNPILPPAAVTQILLLANPNKEKVQLQYRLTFTMGEQEHSEGGSLEQFPPPETWGNL